MEKMEGKDWIGLRVRRDGKVTDMYINQLADGRLMHSNSWIEANGWTTDAYMFTVTYDEGTDPAEAEDFFICYGSALRRGELSYYSSLSKLFVMKHTDGRTLDVDVQGQPFVNVRLRAAKRPSSLSVNGEPTPVSYKDGLVRFQHNE